MIKKILARLFARWTVYNTARWASQPVKTQRKVFESLIASAADTKFGKDHDFAAIKSHADFVKKVPVRDYEALKPYVMQVVEGASDVLWPGKPLYFAKTSGTTSGAKYIPLTKASMPFHIQAARDAILHYIHDTKNATFVNGKMIFLQGSPELEAKNGIKFGRLSGIVAHYVPNYLQRNRMPSWETNCIEDWEAKVDAIVSETIQEDMTVISGIPPWVQMYFEKLRERSGKNVGDLFKNFSLFIYGGVNYEPYRTKFESLIGRRVDSIELFPASEGFFAYQDSQREKGMLLLLNSGIFYEFIPAEAYGTPDAPRLTIAEVSMGVNYAMVVSTNAGLWGYDIGDTVQFTSLSPYRVIVSGRVKHFISAFGEHVIAKEVEQAMKMAVEKFPCTLAEFSVSPQITPESGLPYHEWLIEFDEFPSDLNGFAQALDTEMRAQNIYYDDLIRGSILRPLVVTPLKPGAFSNYMKSIGKLGGQNKLPRLCNDRSIADVVKSAL